MIESIKWVCRVSYRYLNYLPGQTASIMLFSLISTLSSTLTLFLPIKIILQLGHDRVPKYLPGLLTDVDKNTLTLVLCGATVGFYILHAFMEKIINCLESRASLVLEGKTPVFLRNKSAMAVMNKSYSRVSSSLAELFIFMVVMGFVAVVYLKLFLVILAYAFLVITGYEIYFMKSSANQANTHLNELENNENSLHVFWFDLGFLLIFAYIVFGFLTGSSPGVMIAFISFLLVRRSAGGLKRTVRNFMQLNARRTVIEPLLFTEPLKRKKRGSHKYLKIKKSEIEDYCMKVLNHVLQEEISNLRVNWYDFEIHDLLAVQLTVNTNNRTFLLKIYQRKRDSRPDRELNLHAMMPQLPALELCDYGELHGHTWVLHEWKEYIDNTDTHQAGYLLNEKLMALKLPKSLLLEWQQVHPPMSQRTGENFWKELENIAEMLSPDLTNDIQALSPHIDSINVSLQKLPMVLINLKESGSTVKYDLDKNAFSMYWAEWSIEPLGAGWPVSDIGLNELEKSLERAKQNTLHLKSVDIRTVKISALIYMLEEYLKRQRFKDALTLIPSIRQIITSSHP